MLTLNEYLLLENRVDFLWEKYKHKLFEALKTCFSRAELEKYPLTLGNAREDYDVYILPTDPTPNKMYLDWLCRQFVAFPRRFYQDANTIRMDLENFDRVKSRMPANARDINYHKTYH